MAYTIVTAIIFALVAIVHGYRIFVSSMPMVGQRVCCHLTLRTVMILG